MTRCKYLNLRYYFTWLLGRSLHPFFNLKSLSISYGIIQSRRLFAFAGAVGSHEGMRSDGSTRIFPEILPRRSPSYVTIEFALTVVGSSRAAFAD